MNLAKVLARKAIYTPWSVLRNNQYRSACVFCFHRSTPLFKGLKNGVNVGVRSAYYATSSDGGKQTKKNFYKILGVSPKATQGQIKNAFYKLSLKHHPDKHKGSEQSHDKFQEISEAYNALANQETRIQYDRELVAQGRLRTEHTQASSPPTSPKKPAESIYNFDEWTRAHYSGQLNRRQRSKIDRAELEKELNKPRISIGSTRTIVLIMFSVVAIMAYYHGKKSEVMLLDP